MAGPNLAIVGASGAVGRELITLLERRATEHAELRLLASARSAGTSIDYRGAALVVNELGDNAFDGIDLALFCASGTVSRQWAPRAVEQGTIVVDNSSAYRMDERTPLVVPEINGHKLRDVRDAPCIVANPNCSTIILVVALDAVRRAFGLSRIVVSTYQAVSGAGAAAMAELRQQSRDVLDGRPASPEIFSEPCAFNVFSHDSAVDPETGHNVEEQKMIDESRKIWEDPALLIAPTCVRVPVMRAHTESVCVTLQRPATEAEFRDTLASAPGVSIVDDREANDFPTAIKADGTDDVLVGRIRPDATQGADGDAYHAYHMLISGDQLRKGAALNALQIAERLLA